MRKFIDNIFPLGYDIEIVFNSQKMCEEICK